MTDKEQKEYLRRLRDFRPIDDDFMRCLFKDNIPLVELVLRIITGKLDLKVIRCETQKDMKRLVGARSICLDAYGEDIVGKKFNVEVQKEDDGANPHRARYHSSVIDIENLDSGQDFVKLPETYVIFITEKDFFGKGKPIYRIERMNLDADETFGDGEHIIYVNGEYRGDTDIGKLMHDFNCTNAKDMNFELMAEKTRYLKETEEGVRQMCKAMEELKEEGIKLGEKRKGKEFALFMLKEKIYTLEKIAETTGLSLEDVKKLHTAQTV